MGKSGNSEKLRPVRASAPQDEDPFSEKVIAELIEEGFTINWRYGYRLANRYDVKRVCAGGQGVVFIVEDLMENGKRYAAKSLKAYFRKPETEAEWERWRDSADDYLRECNIWVDLGKHRHIVQAEYLEKIEGVPLVMSEFIDGGSLKDWLEKGPLDLATAVDFAIQSCVGMEYANRKGVVVHRDIKPGNVLVTRDGCAKINDFGIAKAVESAETIRPEAEPYLALDSASLLVSRGGGTPPYMAPEQFHEFLLDYAGYPVVPLGRGADIYAFGLVLYEMITGRRVVEIESDREMEIRREASYIASRFNINLDYVYCFLKALKFSPPPPSRSEHLNAVILKCLTKQPGKRYHSFTELREELIQVYREETGKEFHVVDEPVYEPNWRNKGKTFWVLGREKEAFEYYDKALEQNPGDTMAWLEKGLASAEAGDLSEFGLCMEMITYMRPSKETEVRRYRKEVLDEVRVYPRDVRLLDKVVHEYKVTEKTRNWILSRIREFKDPFREIDPILSRLLEQLRDKDRSVRWNAIKGLSDLGDRSAVPALIEALNDEDMGEVAAEALGKLEDKSAVPALIKVLKNRSYLVRAEVAKVLGQLGDTSAVPSLIETLEDENDWVRSEAAKALGELGDKSTVPALIKALDDEDPSVQAHAAEALGKLGDKSAVPALKPLRERKNWARFTAAKALAELGDESVVPALAQDLKNEDRDVPWNAAKWLGILGDRSAVPALMEALKDEDTAVRLNAAEALAKLGDRSAVPALIKALDDEDPDVRFVVAEALAELGDKSGALTLEAVRDKRVKCRFVTRKNAAMALAKLGDKSSVPALIEALMDREDLVRDVPDALGKLGDKSAVPTLVEALSHEDALVRIDAVKALRLLRDESVVPTLIVALRDVSSEVRFSAAKAVAELGGRAVLQTLIEALSFPDPGPVLVALREVCSKPDEARLSQMKDKLKSYSAFEWNEGGSELMAQGEYGKALGCFDMAIEIDPDWEEPKKARDECLKNVDKGIAQPTVAELEESVPASIETPKVKPEAVEWLRKGTALFDLGKYEEAIECYDKALEIDSRYVDAWYCKGMILNRLGEHQEAIECFDKAVKINPAHGLSWYNMGYALSKLNRLEEAIQCYDKALEVDPKDADAWYSKGYNLAMLGRYEKAIQCYDKTLKINPRYAYAWAGKGIALHQLGKRKEAMKCLRKALEVDPSLRGNLASLLNGE